MKICIFGAGAVGGHIAAKLAAGGHDVSVIARGAHLDAMRDKGIALVHGERVISARVRALPDASTLGVQDFVFVTLKANALGDFAAAARPIVGPGTGVVFGQNGIPWWYGIGLSGARPKPPDLSKLDPAGRLQNLLRPAQIIGGVVYSANEVREPGVIVNNVPGNNMIVVGRADDAQSEGVLSLRKLLRDNDISSPETTDIRTSVWGKIVQALGTGALCTLTEAAIATVRQTPGLARLAARLGDEGRAIAQAHGVDPEQAPKRPSGGQTSGLIAHKPSMLQDYERGRPMEIEAQLLATLAFARVANVAAPVLETIVPLVAFKASARGLYADKIEAG
jgi:2-dehydropantoate 2-reductase